MVFKRRDPLSWGAWLREQVYPRSGFKRATRYVLHRMRRLPDQPHRIARGVFAGSLVGFLPLPGMQFIAAWAASRAINGNLLAALLATFNTNPVTTPFFAVLAMTLGHLQLQLLQCLLHGCRGQLDHFGRHCWLGRRRLGHQFTARQPQFVARGAWRRTDLACRRPPCTAHRGTD